jgi:hypothetical protein
MLGRDVSILQPHHFAIWIKWRKKSREPPSPDFIELRNVASDLGEKFAKRRCRDEWTLCQFDCQVFCGHGDECLSPPMRGVRSNQFPM